MFEVTEPEGVEAVVETKRLFDAVNQSFQSLLEAGNQIREACVLLDLGEGFGVFLEGFGVFGGFEEFFRSLGDF